jgi:hypothetical protein
MLIQPQAGRAEAPFGAAEAEALVAALAALEELVELLLHGDKVAVVLVALASSMGQLALMAHLVAAAQVVEVVAKGQTVVQAASHQAVAVAVVVATLDWGALAVPVKLSSLGIKRNL